MTSLRHVLPLVLAACAAPLAGVAARTIEVGPDKPYKTPSAGIAAAADGDTVRIAAGEYFDCAIVSRNDVTIEGAGPDAAAVLTDRSCAGKGLLVTSGNNITIRNLTLTRARVPDGNGAGIRGEGGNLTVEGVKFINNQDGILANTTPQGTIVIRNSTFIRNGTCVAACAHGIYVGTAGLLKVENSTFSDTRQGHHIKSRALRTEITGNSIIDGPTGTASYLIDIPSGGSLVVSGNTMEKGPNAENQTAAIMIGEDGVSQPTREITVANNSFRNAGAYRTVFVINMTATEAMLKGNRISGQVEPLKGDGVVK